MRFEPSAVRAVAMEAPGGWRGTALAWDVAAGILEFMTAGSRGWAYAAVWAGPDAEVRAAAGRTATSEEALAACSGPPSEPGPLGDALAGLGVPFRGDLWRGASPEGWARTAFELAGIGLPLDPAVAVPLMDRPFGPAEYADLRDDRSGRISEMLAAYPVLRGFVGSEVSTAYRAGGVPAAARRLSALAGSTIPAAALRRLRGVAVRVESPAETLTTLAFLGTLPIDLCPGDENGYEAAGAVAAALAILADPSDGYGAPARPEALARRVGKALGIGSDTSPALLNLSLRDLPEKARDRVAELARDLVGPALRLRGDGADPESVAREALFGGLDLARAAAALAAREKGRVEQERAMPPPKAYDFAFPRPCPDFRAPTGATVVPLASRRALMEEAAPGEGLDHCAGNAAYSRDCAAGRSVILSIRGGDGRPLATAEVQPSGSGLRVRQFQGRSGGHACPEARDAWQAWLSAVANGEITVGFVPFDLPEGYDEANPANVRMAMEAWRPLLAGRIGDWADIPPGPTP